VIVSIRNVIPIFKSQKKDHNNGLYYITTQFQNKGAVMVLTHLLPFSPAALPARLFACLSSYLFLRFS